MSAHAKQIKALKLGIEALTKERRQFSPGHVAYRTGIRSSKIDSDGTTGVSFVWVERDERKYQEYSEAIRQLEDLIEVLEDPGAVGMKQGRMEF